MEAALAKHLLKDQPQEARGLRVHFRVASLGQDLDDLCEPVLSVLVNKAGWFRGRRSNIRWFEASKSVDTFTGCHLAVSRDPTPVWRTPDGQPLLDALYPGPLPRSARDPAMAAWALANRQQVATGPCLVRLSFASPRVNLGDVATGPVKSAIDCLYPVLGGQPGRPVDDLVTILQVEKGPKHAGTVRVTISSVETS